MEIVNHFRENLKNYIKIAEQELLDLNYEKTVWKFLISEMTFYPGSKDIIFKSDSGLCLDKKVTKNKRLRGLDAFFWAQIAVIAHRALDCTDPEEMFQLGLSLQQKIHFLGLSSVINHSQRKRATKGGEARKGQFSPLKKAIQTILKTDPKLKRSEFIKIFNSAGKHKYWKNLVAADVDIERVDLGTKELTYVFNDERFTLTFHRISVIISELRRTTKKV